MKKITLAIALIAATFAVQAQNFNIGLGGGIYSTWLINSNVSDQGEDVDFSSTFGGQIGLNTQYYFKDNLGISLGIFTTGNSQKYTGTFSTTNTYEAKTKIRYLDVPFLLRFGGGAKGAYFEFGPQFCFLSSAKQTFTSTPASPGDAFLNLDVKQYFKGSNIAAVMGFGVDIDASENIIVSTGLRLGYGFSDVTKQYPENELSDVMSLSDYYAHFNNKNVYGYKSTNRAFGGLFITVVYKIPVKGGTAPAPK